MPNWITSESTTRPETAVRARLCFRGTQKIYRDVSSRRVSHRKFVVFMLGGKMVRPICILLLSLLLQGCTRPSVHEPVTLTLLEEWSNKTFSEARQQELQQFTRETGIRVTLLPSPDSARQRLVLWRELLGTGASGPDVYGIDASHRCVTITDRPGCSSDSRAFFSLSGLYDCFEFEICKYYNRETREGPFLRTRTAIPQASLPAQET